MPPRRSFWDNADQLKQNIFQPHTIAIFHFLCFGIQTNKVLAVSQSLLASSLNNIVAKYLIPVLGIGYEA